MNNIYALFDISNDESNNHINLIKKFLDRYNFNDKVLNSYNDTENDRMWFLITDEPLSDMHFIIEANNIIVNEENEKYYSVY